MGLSSELRSSITFLSERGLIQATRWAAEFLHSIKDDTDEGTDAKVTVSQDDSLFLLAKSYFDLREFYRVAHYLTNSTSSKARFLELYSLYLAGEKNKEEQQKSDAINPELQRIRVRLQDSYENDKKNMDSFLLYLYGVVLKASKMKSQAQVILIESVNLYPWNWSAWLELASLFSEVDATSQLSATKGKLKECVMKEFFMAHLALELQQNEEASELYEGLRSQFPNNDYVLSQIATANYNSREFDAAEQLFEQLFDRDPHRLEGLDVYSNILYVKENKARLSFLAHRACETDKYRAETCCIIGNYYSIKSDHEKAVLYFERALKLNRNYLAAWTLMGHEYVELKNTKAAIEAYRKAVEINPRDYRAWYGLGQTYEILKMNLYSLYYYNKATALRPYDARMWCAVGTCYEQLDRLEEAVKCFERAASNEDREGIALDRLARLYQKMGDENRAAACFQRNLQIREHEGVEGDETIDAILYLANYFRDRGDYDEAETYANRLLDYSGKPKDDGKALLKEIANLRKNESDGNMNQSIRSLDMSIDLTRCCQKGKDVFPIVLPHAVTEVISSAAGRIAIPGNDSHSSENKTAQSSPVCRERLRSRVVVVDIFTSHRYNLSDIYKPSRESQMYLAPGLSALLVGSQSVSLSLTKIITETRPANSVDFNTSLSKSLASVAGSPPKPEEKPVPIRELARTNSGEDIEHIGLKSYCGINLETTDVWRNPAPPVLYEHALRFEKGSAISSTGALICSSGARTGRSPRDKRIVKESTSEADIWWGRVNIPMEETIFTVNRERAIDYLNTRERLYVIDGYAGWNPQYRIKIRVVCARAYHALFMRNMLIRPTPEELAHFGSPDFTIYNAGQFPANRYTNGMTSSTSVSINFKRREMVILGTEYAGEMKKGVFSVMHYLMPKAGALSLHSSANMGPDNSVTLFFGLSGTGKTTLSADPHRQLIGDDEHCWDDQGVFNIEGGCYAKAIDLSREQEPEIFDAIRFGSVLENVVFDDQTREVDYHDVSLTQNTRACYPIEYISNARVPCVGPHPNNIIMLSCDAFGVLPPVVKLTPEMAMYYFISGYTAKVAGTEVGITEPEATFSACFGDPFLVLHPTRYAEMLAEKMRQHKAEAWLINTGWIGGGYGVGSRIKLKYTRAIIDAIHSGELAKAPTVASPVFGFHIPTKCSGVPDEILQPRLSWTDAASYDKSLNKLAGLFSNNIAKFDIKSKEILQAGPQVETTQATQQ
ncbi:phosphoenolpyruvate carboxykinase [Planoprotostelium fungivorum]|uniref:Phosphoenolpyruvate carboxykinase (ATP) n=1 Tax=Planoprotostelium fungivorum TaxID=1890364 RepID=A0A2P6MPD3_9EUKA|nr:phosphoenolpyruvate carboxykinase [Planoprotostelium fungivorum]